MAQSRLIWFKNAIIPADEALVPVLSPTAQFGLNVFEGVRGYWSGEEIFLFRFHEHFVRLQQSCRLIGLACPYSEDELLGFCRDIIAANDYACDVALRITVFVDGEGSWINNEPVGVFIAPIARDRSTITEETRNTACVSSWARISDNAMPPRVKLGANYMNSRYAMMEARRNGYDMPIFLGEDGKVAEGSGSCLFLVRDGKLITPSLTSSILEGITRDTVITFAKERGLTVEERAVDRTELYIADEVFLCGSAAELTPLTSVDGHEIGTGAPGALTTSLHTAYLAIASGDDAAHAEWRTSMTLDAA